MKTLGGIFGRRATGPLHEHMLKVNDILDALPELLLAACEGNKPKCRQLTRAINRYESDADEIKEAICTHLSKSIFGSVERQGILEVSEYQDDIADSAQNAAQMFEIAVPPIPEELRAPLLTIGANLRKAGGLLKEISTAVAGEEPGRERTLAALTGHISKITDLDHDTRRRRVAGLKALIGDDPVKLDHRQTLVLFKVFNFLGECSSVIENTAESIRRLIV